MDQTLPHSRNPSARVTLPQTQKELPISVACFIKRAKKQKPRILNLQKNFHVAKSSSQSEVTTRAGEARAVTEEHTMGLILGLMSTKNDQLRLEFHQIHHQARSQTSRMRQSQNEKKNCQHLILEIRPIHHSLSSFPRLSVQRGTHH